jgi:glutaredoxin
MEEDSGRSNIRIDNNPDKKVNISNLQEQVKKNPWMISTIILGILALILLIIVFRGGVTGNVISADVAGERLIEFANSQGAAATLVEVNDNGEFYEVVVSINGQELPLYVTKDGEFFTQSLIPLTGDVVNSNANTQTPAEVSKSDKPKVELYVFTYCPYGTQAEKGIIPVVKLLGDKIDFKIRQIGAMHGEYEKIEAERQLCIEKQAPAKFLDYVNSFASNAEIGNCRGDATCVALLIDALYIKLGINKAGIESCMKTDGAALYSAEETNSKAEGVSGSPTLIINGENVQSGRDSASYLKTICSAFNTAPAECDEVLSSASPSPGFGASTTTSESTGAQC